MQGLVFMLYVRHRPRHGGRLGQESQAARLRACRGGGWRQEATSYLNHGRAQEQFQLWPD